MPRGNCLHCKAECWIAGRHLCSRCHKNDDIRSLYPLCNGRTEEDTARDREPEPTEAELDAMIAEQSKPENLPAWWDGAIEREQNLRACERPPKRYILVKC